MGTVLPTDQASALINVFGREDRDRVKVGRKQLTPFSAIYIYASGRLHGERVCHVEMFAPTEKEDAATAYEALEHRYSQS